MASWPAADPDGAPGGVNQHTQELWRSSYLKTNVRDRKLGGDGRGAVRQHGKGDGGDDRERRTGRRQAGSSRARAAFGSAEQR